MIFSFKTRSTSLRQLAIAMLAVSLLVTGGCDKPAQEDGSIQPAATQASPLADSGPPLPAEKAPPEPPSPPIREDFEGEPQLSLFPRVGDFRPDDEEKDRIGYWLTFIDHLKKTSGLVQSSTDGNHAWGFRSINTIDSVGYFSPLAVLPGTTYRVDFRIQADLPEGASAGIGLMEFRQFLWEGDQLTEKMFSDNALRVTEGIRLTGQHGWERQSFTFTTSPETHMIHLVLFRDGLDSKQGVLFDDISVAVVSSDKD